MTIAAFCLYLLCSVGGLVLFKLGTAYPAVRWLESLVHLKFSVISLCGCACYVVSFLLYLFLVSRNELSLLFPIATGISCILVLTASAFVLHEQISPVNWIGAIVIVIGILLVNIGRHG